MELRSAVLLPAVLGVIAINSDISIRLPVLSDEKSKKKNQTAGRIISIAVAESIILDCRRYSRNLNLCFLMSSHVRKPIPPETISNETVITTSGFPAYAVSDANSLPLPPSMSIPALQKDETEWKIPYHTPLKNPNSGTKTIDRRTAPMNSITKVVDTIKRISLTTPPI